MKYYRWAVISFLLLNAYSCQQISNDKTTTEDSIPTGAAQYQAIYRLDTAQSVATWIVSTPEGKYDGILMFSSPDSLFLSADGPITGSLHLCIECIRVSGIPDSDTSFLSLLDVLASPSALYASRYPVATLDLMGLSAYDSTRTYPDKQEMESPFIPEKISTFMLPDPTHILSARLTIRGITHDISLPVKINLSPRQLTLESRFNLDRTDWGIDTLSGTSGHPFIYHTLNAGLYIQAIEVPNP